MDEEKGRVTLVVPVCICLEIPPMQLGTISWGGPWTTGVCLRVQVLTRKLKPQKLNVQPSPTLIEKVERALTNDLADRSASGGEGKRPINSQNKLIDDKTWESWGRALSRSPIVERGDSSVDSVGG